MYSIITYPDSINYLNMDFIEIYDKYLIDEPQNKYNKNNNHKNKKNR